jgi:hypothetical protein
VICSARNIDPAALTRLKGHMVGMFTQGVLLSNCDDRFFDKEKWHALVAKCSDVRKALYFLNTIGFLGMYVLRGIAKGTSTFAPEFQSHLAKYELGEVIVKDFRNRLVNGELIASGVHMATDSRIQIPKALWNDLVFDFHTDRAKWAHDVFFEVKIRLPDLNRTEADDSVQSCTAWLKQRFINNQNEPKKVLRALAFKELRPLSHRNFDAAYATVFKRKAGRPPKS